MVLRQSRSGSRVKAIFMKAGSETFPGMG